jgi:hypothetical protein
MPRKAPIMSEATVRLSVSVPLRLAAQLEAAAHDRRQSKKVLYEEALERLLDSRALSVVLGTEAFRDLEILARHKGMSVAALVTAFVSGDLERAKAANPEIFSVQQLIPFGPYLPPTEGPRP